MAKATRTKTASKKGSTATAVKDEKTLLQELFVDELKAEYYETQTRTKNSIWHQAVNMVSTWFGSANHVGPSTYFPAS